VTTAVVPINDASANQILALRRQPQQSDLGRDEPAIGLLVNPFKHWSVPRESLVHLLTGQFPGAPAPRLELGTDIRRCQLGQPFHRHSVKTASVLIAEQEASGIGVKDYNRLWSMLDQGSQPGFAGAERDDPLGDPALQQLIQFQQLTLGLLALADVTRNDDMEFLSAHEDRSR